MPNGSEGVACYAAFVACSIVLFVSWELKVFVFKVRAHEIEWLRWRSDRYADCLNCLSRIQSCILTVQTAIFDGTTIRIVKTVLYCEFLLVFAALCWFIFPILVVTVSCEQLSACRSYHEEGWRCPTDFAFGLGSPMCPKCEPQVCRPTRSPTPAPTLTPAISTDHNAGALHLQLFREPSAAFYAQTRTTEHSPMHGAPKLYLRPQCHSDVPCL